MRQATIRDVAKLAHVSPATVSRVLNTSAGVSPDLKERVLAAVGELGYRPNGQARGLRKRATMVLGVIVSDITNPFFTSMVRGAESAAREAGYSVVLANADESVVEERRHLEVAAAEQMAGVLLCPASASTRIDILTERGIPVVTVDRRLGTADVDQVTVNNRVAARQTTLHLAEQGCRRIGFVAGRLGTTTGSERLAGYLAGLAEAGLPADPRLMVSGDFRVDGGREATRRLLVLPDRPDGLFVSNNLMTIGAIQALHEAGVRLAEDIVLAAFDDMLAVAALGPPITAVRQPTYDIGRRATELLLRRISGERTAREHVVLPATLEIRHGTRLRQDARAPHPA